MNPKITLSAFLLVGAAATAGYYLGSRSVASTRKPSVEEIIPLVEHAAQTGRWAMSKRWEIIIDALGSSDFSPLLAVLARHPPSPARSRLMWTLYSRWAECAPAAALAHAELSDGTERWRLVNAVMEGWAFTDPQAAAEWALRLPKGRQRNSALRIIVRQLATEDPVRMVEFARQAGMEEDPDFDVGWIYANWAAADPAGATVRAGSLSENARRQAYGGIAETWAHRDPAAAAQWASSLSTPLERRVALSHVIGVWSAAAPADAAAFVSNLGGGDLGQQMTNVLLNGWINADPGAAWAWMQRQIQIRDMHHYFKALARQWVMKDPQEARLAAENMRRA